MDRLPMKAVSLLGMAIGSDAILAEEAHGQRALVNSTELPADMRGDRAIFEGMGIKFKYKPRDAEEPVSVETVEGDPMFCEATLPPGWSKRRTDHAMWSDLIDDKGRKRASIFYKAAFYDRSAHMSPSRRYGVAGNYSDPDRETVARAYVRDGDKTIWTSEAIPITPENDRGTYNREKHEYDVPPVRDIVKAQCAAWLDEHKPDWKNPLAYWDEP